MRSVKFLIFRSFTAMATAFLIAIAATSCSQRELCYEHEHWVDVQVDFDWSHAPEANPVTMVVYFFPDDTDSRGMEGRSFEFNGGTGGTVRLLPGKYKIICFNGGTETLLERGSSYQDLHLFTDNQEILAPMNTMSAGAPRPEGSRSEDVRHAPDRVWSDACESFTVIPVLSGQTVKMTPVETTTRLTVTVGGVENIQSGITLSAAITGLAEAMTLSDKSPAGKGATMPLPLSLNPDGSVSGSIDIFGHCPDTPLTHTLTIYTSNRYYFNFDVTGKLHEAFAEGRREININIEKITIPDTGQDSGSGMSPSVPGWDEVVDVFIEMN